MRLLLLVFVVILAAAVNLYYMLDIFMVVLKLCL